MIDGGLSRTGRSSDRQPMYRTETVRTQPDPQIPVERATQDGAGRTPRPATQPQPKKGTKGLGIGLAIAAVLLLAVAAWFFAPRLLNGDGAAGVIDDAKYQAVFFSNGQVYFGKLEVLNSQYYRLSDAFYVQADAAVDENDQQNTEAITSQKLIKRGGEVYGPESPMIIDRTQVMFFENLRSDSQVSQLMRDYK